MSIKMLLSLHLNVWRYKCINIPIYFYMSMIYKCLCVCERMCLYITSQMLFIFSLPKMQWHYIRRLLAYAWKPVATDVREEKLAYVTIQLNSELDLSCPFSPPATDKCLHTHTHTCTCMRVHLMIVYPINCLYFGEGVLEWEGWV